MSSHNCHFPSPTRPPPPPLPSFFPSAGCGAGLPLLPSSPASSFSPRCHSPTTNSPENSSRHVTDKHSLTPTWHTTTLLVCPFEGDLSRHIFVIALKQYLFCCSLRSLQALQQFPYETSMTPFERVPFLGFMTFFCPFRKILHEAHLKTFSCFAHVELTHHQEYCFVFLMMSTSCFQDVRATYASCMCNSVSKA